MDRPAALKPHNTDRQDAAGNAKSPVKRLAGLLAKRFYHSQALQRLFEDPEPALLDFRRRLPEILRGAAPRQR